MKKTTQKPFINILGKTSIPLYNVVHFGKTTQELKNVEPVMYCIKESK
jgi:hypothetical protein